MSSLPPILISTDFDGTIFETEKADPFAPSFFQWIEEARRKRTVYWAINTGRDWESLTYSLEKHRAPIWPDWVVLLEREIHKVENFAQVPFSEWNANCHLSHEELYTRTHQIFKTMTEKFKTMEGLRIIEDRGSPFGLVAATEEQADEVSEFIADLLKDEKQLVPVRNSIYFRFSHRDFNKGSSLGAIRDHLGLKADQCFAIGDHFNDLPMLTGHYAKHVGCPLNAVAEVHEQVKSRGGFSATKHTYLGVVEALENFFPL